MIPNTVIFQVYVPTPLLGPNGEQGAQPVAMAPTFEDARSFVAKNKIGPHAIFACVCVTSTITSPSPVLGINGRK
jgi:hypothetical protein